MGSVGPVFSDHRLILISFAVSKIELEIVFFIESQLPKITFRVTEHLKSLITERAKSGNQSVSNYIRAVVLGANQICTSFELEDVRESFRRIVELAHALRLSYGERDPDLQADWEAFFQALYELERSLLSWEESDNGTRAVEQE